MNDDISASLGAFDPPLAVGDRLKSRLNRPCDGWLVVDEVQERGVVLCNESVFGRGGHIFFGDFSKMGTNGAGYIRLSRGP